VNTPALQKIVKTALSDSKNTMAKTPWQKTGCKITAHPALDEEQNFTQGSS